MWDEHDIKGNKWSKSEKHMEPGISSSAWLEERIGGLKHVKKWEIY